VFFFWVVVVILAIILLAFIVHWFGGGVLKLKLGDFVLNIASPDRAQPWRNRSSHEVTDDVHQPVPARPGCDL